MVQIKSVLVDINDLFNYHNSSDYDIKVKIIIGIMNLINIADERFYKDILEVSQEQINFDHETMRAVFNIQAEKSILALLKKNSKN